MSMRYVVLDHSADVKIKAYGKNIEECFGNMAYAMFDQMVHADKIQQSVTKTINVKGDSDEDKLYAMLSELLFISDTSGLVFNDFIVSIVEDNVECIAKGEQLDLQKHRPKREIKAVTYHMLEVDRKENTATVIFDA